MGNKTKVRNGQFGKKQMKIMSENNIKYIQIEQLKENRKKKLAFSEKLVYIGKVLDTARWSSG